MMTHRYVYIPPTFKESQLFECHFGCHWPVSGTGEVIFAGVVILAGVVAVKSVCLSLSSTCFTGDGVIDSVSDVSALALSASLVISWY